MNPIHSEVLIEWLDGIDYFLWSRCLIFLLVGVGLFLTFRLRGMQFKYLPYALKLAFTRQDDQAQGDISQFQALMTALAATIGIGSIAGVATAIVGGGMGAIFWMWVIALIGMATKYAEAILAIKFRTKDHRGEMCGGPMYYIRKGLKWKWLAGFFAVSGMLSAFAGGNLTQAHSIADAIYDLLHIPPLWTGLIVALATGLIVIGGIGSIGRVCSVLVPIMAGLYIVGGLFIIIVHAHLVPASFVHIVKSAFTGEAMAGGFVGATVIAALQFGVARGISSNEAGLGSGPIAAAAAKTDVPGRHALISMTTVFLSTLVVCTITALVISVTGVLGQTDAEGKLLNGAPLVMEAFRSVLPFGDVIVAVGLILFGYSTIIGWSYYGEKCMEYLAGERAIYAFRVIFCLFVFVGALMSIELVWPLVDIMNGLMTLPNLIGLIALSSVVVKESNEFFKLLKRERDERIRDKTTTLAPSKD
ncbi:alanine/glycine:cation symporter family protein [Simkania sp.]|uniref:alanine/glycine:cation symporter family protein n=1 Tax=Simkania sp. TaxID=34094 RepID=UPI003B51AAEA